MNDAPTPLPSTDPDTHASRVQAALWRQYELVERLAEAGLRVALGIEQQAAAEPPPDPSHTAMAFARVARAVRMAVLLQARLVKDMDAARQRALFLTPRMAEAADIAAARARAQADPAHGHKARVEKIVERQVKAVHPDDEETVERLMLEAADRLDDDDIYRDVMNRPVGELVSLICRDLGLEPDWTALAREAWAQDEIASGTPNSPFNRRDSARAPPFSAENGGEDPLADPGAKPGVERVGVGAGGFHPPPDRSPERPHTWSG